ncbi:MAG TPA: hypothetical protein VMV37_02785 [Gammaproteobacteria bacterium]|nr:hypothetical protein [Gammaproteobacteria bacterium]
MDFTLVDGYLLGRSVSKAEVVSALLSDRSAEPAAAPFYRALEAVGTRAADEAFVALRLILAGQAASDERVRRIRALSAVARAAAADDRKTLAAARTRDAQVLGDFAGDDDLPRVVARAREAYALEFAGGAPER